MDDRPVIYLSIDVEASGPFPGLFSLASVGAAPVRRVDGLWQVDRAQTFYVELKPLEGVGEIPEKSAAWPASFDHPYVGWYLQRFLGRNPLGHSGFDIASYAMGLFGTTSRNATFRAMDRAMKAEGYRPPENEQPHHGLHDAIEQGETLAWLLRHAEAR